jgi:F1F0 ATPase subunit 2
MTTGDLLAWLVPLAGGAAIGLLYFAGLWATVRRLPSVRRPGLLVFASFVARIAVAVAGFVVLLGGDARRAVVALVGFLAVRTIAVRRGRDAATAKAG